MAKKDRIKRLTKAQKEIVSVHGYNAKNWYLLEETDLHIKIQSKKSGKQINIEKFVK